MEADNYAVKPARERQAISIEEIKPQYQGTWMPARVMRLFWKKKISPREAMLLATIDSLTQRDDDGKVLVGCFAGNDYLAQLIGVSEPTRVSHIISKLKKLGLVRQTYFDGRRRYLVTKWGSN